jgi:hypothetical protein
VKISTSTKRDIQGLFTGFTLLVQNKVGNYSGIFR